MKRRGIRQKRRKGTARGSKKGNGKGTKRKKGEIEVFRGEGETRNKRKFKE